MLFVYQAIDTEGQEKKGTIEAINLDVAIASLQRRGFVISNINEAETEGSVLSKNIAIFDRVSNRDIVILSRQMATLFESQISALRTFRLLAAETENPKLSRKLADISESLQGGSTISDSLAKHPDVFSPFYVNMVKAGEESGKLDETFEYLADYLDRTYEVTQKAKNALIYPAFVVFTFIVVMVLMLTLVIPKISAILTESGQDVPAYTQVVIGLSNFFINYGIFLLIAFIVGLFFLFRFVRTETGKESYDRFKLEVPYVGNLYKKLYLSRIADNMDTMLASGIPVVKALELTQSVVDNRIYLDAIEKSTEIVKGGSAVSDAFAKHQEQFPNIFIQMMRVGEESGNLGSILSSLAKFYRREVTNAVDTLVGLIEPTMIILLALGVGTLLASVLIPIYNISSTF
ncbi:type II secretion system F family protein [Candidatus Nomurabacteria bacterium]|nr:type II secretion system F family protein [Candidatus Nomurabacteria bacterium]